jgi:mannose-1-phosphate guanylyltransferase
LDPNATDDDQSVRDAILRPPVPQNIFICNIDIASSFPLAEIMALHDKTKGVGTIMGVNVRFELGISLTR